MKRIKKLSSLMTAILLLISIMPAMIGTVANAAPAAGYWEYVPGTNSGEAVVYTAAAMREVITTPACAHVSKIYLGADITMTDNSRITRNLTFDGYNPLNTGQSSPYTLTDRSQNGVGNGMFVNGFTGTVTFQNISIRVRNNHGIVPARNNSADAYTLVFDNVYGEGGQFVYNRYGTVILKDNNEFRLNSIVGGQTQQEFAECRNLFVEGKNNKIVRDPGGNMPTDAIVWLANDDGVVWIRPGGELFVDTQIWAQTARGFAYTSSRCDLIIDEGGVFEYYSATHFATPGNRFRNITVNGKLTTIVNGSINHGSNNPLIEVLDFTVGRGADVFIAAQQGNNGSSILSVSGTLTVNDAGEIVLYHGGNGNALRGNGKAVLGSIRRIGVNDTATGLSQYSPGFTFTSPTAYNLVDCFVTGFNGFNATTDTNLNNATSPNYAGMTKAPWSPPTMPTDILSRNSKMIEINGDFSTPPTINPVYEGENVVSGKGTHNSEVTVTLPGYPMSGGPFIVMVDAGGTWSVNLPGSLILQGNDIIEAVQREVLKDGSTLRGPSSPPTVSHVLFRTLKLYGDNETKTYYTEGLTAVRCSAVYSSNEGETLLLSSSTRYILLDPSSLDAALAMANPVDDSFDAIYNSTPPSKRGVMSISNYTGTVPLTANATVWVQSEVTVNGAARKVGAAREFRNLYIQKEIYVRGVVADEAVPRILFPYTHVEEGSDVNNPGKYGIPVNYDGVVIPNPKSGYDSVVIKIIDRLSRHWEGKIKGIADTPYTLILDSNLESANILFDQNAPKPYYYYTIQCVKIPGMWSSDIAVFFVEDEVAETPVMINGVWQETLSVPFDLDYDNTPMNQCTGFWENGAVYQPPGDIDYTPNGWLVGTSWDYSLINPCNDFSDQAGFNPKFYNLGGGALEDHLYISYSRGLMAIEERYMRVSLYSPVLTDETAIDNDKITIIPAGEKNTGYSSIAPAFAGVVPVGYRLEGISGDTGFRPFDYAGYASSVPGTLPSLNQNGLIGVTLTKEQLNAANDMGENVAVVYIYATDSTGSGIPDMEAGTIAAVWDGYYLGQIVPAPIAAQKIIHIRAGYPFSVCNDMNDPSPIAGGNPHHTIVRGSGLQYSGTWMFDRWDDPLAPGFLNNPPEHIVTINPDDVYAKNPSKVTGIFFSYAYASDGTYPDKMQYVLERYHFFDETNSDAETPIPGAANTLKYLMKGETYSKTPTVLPGYVYVGYRINENANIITYLQGQTPQEIVFNTQDYNQTITLLYRRQAAPATIAWVGMSYSGYEVTLGTLAKTGYIGESFTVGINDITLSPQWVAENSPSAHSFALSDTAQSYSFTFREVIDFSVIKVIFASDDGNFHFVMTTERLPSTSPYEQNAIRLDNYEMTGYDIFDTYGDLIDEGVGMSAVIDPGKGSQTLTFHYKSLVTSIFVRAYDENGVEIAGSVVQYTDAVIGETYAVTAPYIEGYLLNEYETIVKVLDPVEAGVNNVRYNYVPATGNVTIIMRDVETNEVIAAISENLIPGADVPIPDLSLSYYDAVSTIPEKFQGMDAETIEYHYSKQTKPITVRAVNAETGQPITSPGATTTFVVAGHKGHMFMVNSPGEIPGYILTGTGVKSVYVDPLDSNIIVDFFYKENPRGEVVVIHNFIVVDNVIVDNEIPLAEPDFGMLEKTDHIKYISGYGDGRVGPDIPITRAEVAMIFHSLLTDTMKNNPVGNPFMDIQDGAWYSQPVKYLAKLGILTGYPDGSFMPSQHITRAEFAAIVSRFEDVGSGGVIPFSDVSGEHWAHAHIAFAYQKGWISGYPDDTFRPNSLTTRAEAIAIINRVLERVLKRDDVPEELMKLYTDLPTTHWAFADVIEASVGHEYLIANDGREIWMRW